MNNEAVEEEKDIYGEEFKLRALSIENKYKKPIYANKSLLENELLSKI
jgi:hypothetical protein